MEGSEKFTTCQIIAHYTTTGDRDPEKIVQFLLAYDDKAYYVVEHPVKASSV